MLKYLICFIVCFFSFSVFASNSSISLTKVSFAKLPGWKTDNHLHALSAFKKSCQEILKRDPKRSFHSSIPNMAAEDWQTICVAANKLEKPDANDARLFFEHWFVPHRVGGAEGHQGVFTGYYLPLIQANLQRTKQFNVPIHALPDDLVKVDLGSFRSDLYGKTIVGQIKNNILTPYPDRMEITKNKHYPNAKVLAWSDNAIDVYFSQVQGSSLVQLPNKKQFMIGYAGNNGHLYTAIGKILIARNQLTKETVSMQSIRAWLIQHPKQAQALLNENASYVFFQILKTSSPVGTEQVPLTPERSLAVDNRYIPFGAPIWLDTRMPDSRAQSVPLQRLLIAQDTGGAIKGAVRGDVYLGPGEDAAFIAGHMNSVGEYWMLLPR